jgi:hypothetical protein
VKVCGVLIVVKRSSCLPLSANTEDCFRKVRRIICGILDEKESNNYVKHVNYKKSGGKNYKTGIKQLINIKFAAKN